MKIKHLLIAILALSCALLGYLYWNDESATPAVILPEDPKIIAFGDSLVEGQGASPGRDLPSRLSVKLNERVINMGKSGDTSAQALARLPAVLREDPDIVIVLLGGNDFLRRIPRAETFANLELIVTTLQSAGAQVVLLGIRGGIFQDNFEESYERLAEETGALYVTDVLAGLLGKDEYMADTVHPNDAGYEKIAERVAAAMRPLLRR